MTGAGAQGRYRVSDFRNYLGRIARPPYLSEGRSLAGGVKDRTKALYAALVGNVDSQALIPVIALYASALGADLLMIGLIVGAYSAVHAPANVAFGHVVDRFGRRRTLIVGLLADAASLALYAVAQTPVHLLLARLLHGFGGGLVGPATMSAVADSAARGRHGRSMALYGMTLGFGVLLGFGLSGGLVLASGDVRSAVPRLVAVLAVLVLSGTVAGATMADVRVGRGARWSDAIPLLRSRAMVSGLVLMFSLYFAVGTFTALYPAHVEDLLGSGADRAVVLSFMLFGVTSVVLHYPGGIVSDRLGARRGASLGLGGLAAGFLLLPLAASGMANAASMILLGLGHAFIFPAASAIVSASTPRDRFGLATGLLYACLMLGAAVGAPLMAAVAGPLGVPGTLALTSLALVPALGVALFVRNHRP